MCMFLFVRSYAELRLKKARENYKRLPAPHRQMLPDFLQCHRNLTRAVDVNYQFVMSLIRGAAGMFENSTVANFVSLKVIVIL